MNPIAVHEAGHGVAHFALGQLPALRLTLHENGNGQGVSRGDDRQASDSGFVDVFTGEIIPEKPQETPEQRRERFRRMARGVA